MFVIVSKFSPTTPSSHTTLLKYFFNLFHTTTSIRCIFIKFIRWTRLYKPQRIKVGEENGEKGGNEPSWGAEHAYANKERKSTFEAFFIAEKRCCCYSGFSTAVIPVHPLQTRWNPPLKHFLIRSKISLPQLDCMKFWQTVSHFQCLKLVLGSDGREI